MLPLLHSLWGFSSIHQASINARNKLGAYVELFTDDLISHVAQKPLMDDSNSSISCNVAMVS